MGRREDITRHHTIRHTFQPERRRGVSPLLMTMLILSLMIAVASLNTKASSKASNPPDPQSPEWQQLLSTATVMSQGQWGPELLDNCLLLSKSFAESGDVSASKYLLMLANGAPPDNGTAKIISDISVNDAEAKIYRLALETSNQNMLHIKEGGSASPNHP